MAGNGSAPGSGLQASIANCVTDIRRRQGDAVPVDRIGVIVGDILGSLSGELTAEDMRLYQELEGLSRYIQQAKQEIASLNPTDIREEFLPTAADELDAIVQATENATGAIMDATEVVEAVASEIDGEASGRLMDATTMIYEACSFQDLTGQRITKVVRMLKSIEDRVDNLIKAFDPETLAAARAASVPTDVQAAGNYGRQQAAAVGDRDGDSGLLNGPQSSASAMAQDDIDALLASFDK